MTETIKELAPYLTALADKLSTTADKVWAMQMMQAKVTMICYAASYTVNILLIIGWMYLWNEYGGKDKDCSGLIAGTIIFGGMALFFMLVINICEFKDFVTVIVNPEYHALQSLLRMVK